MRLSYFIFLLILLIAPLVQAAFAPATGVSLTGANPTKLSVTGWQFVFTDVYAWNGASWQVVGKLSGSTPEQGNWLVLSQGSQANLSFTPQTTYTHIAVFACNQLSASSYDCNGIITLDSNSQIVSHSTKWMVQPLVQQPQPRYDCKKVYGDGNPNEKINLFFVSDGFDDQTINIFRQNVDRAIDLAGTSNGLFSKIPYKDNKNAFNIYEITSNAIFDCLTTHNSGPSALTCDYQSILDIPKNSCSISKIDHVALFGYPYSPVNPNEKRSGIWNNDKLSVLLTDIINPD